MSHDPFRALTLIFTHATLGSMAVVMCLSVYPLSQVGVLLNS